MKISELIAGLTDIQELLGPDLEVEVELMGEDCYATVTEVTVAFVSPTCVRLSSI